jgi:hypothetical protein
MKKEIDGRRKKKVSLPCDNEKKPKLFDETSQQCYYVKEKVQLTG